MANTQQDCHRISSTVIEAVKQHPVLYINDVKGCSMKLPILRQKVWDRIADEVNLDGNNQTLMLRLLLLNKSNELKYFCSWLGEIKVEKFEGHLLPNTQV